jgi:hypothetical protein
VRYPYLILSTLSRAPSSLTITALVPPADISLHFLQRRSEHLRTFLSLFYLHHHSHSLIYPPWSPSTRPIITSHAVISPDHPRSFSFRLRLSTSNALRTKHLPLQPSACTSSPTPESPRRIAKRKAPHSLRTTENLIITAFSEALSGYLNGFIQIGLEPDR